MFLYWVTFYTANLVSRYPPGAVVARYSLRVASPCSQAAMVIAICCPRRIDWRYAVQQAREQVVLPWEEGHIQSDAIIKGPPGRSWASLRRRRKLCWTMFRLGLYLKMTCCHKAIARVRLGLCLLQHFPSKAPPKSQLNAIACVLQHSAWLGDLQCVSHRPCGSLGINAPRAMSGTFSRVPRRPRATTKKLVL